MTHGHREMEKSSRNTQSNRAEQGKGRERKSRKMKEKLRLTKRSLLTSITCTILAISNIKDNFLRGKKGVRAHFSGGLKFEFRIGLSLE